MRGRREVRLSSSDLACSLCQWQHLLNTGYNSSLLSFYTADCTRLVVIDIPE